MLRSDADADHTIDFRLDEDAMGIAIIIAIFEKYGVTYAIGQTNLVLTITVRGYDHMRDHARSQ